MLQSNLSDKEMLTHMLMTEKFVSNSYDLAVMESACQNVRQTLQQIQKDEQEHAKRIFDAMNQRGWYNIKPASNL